MDSTVIIDLLRGHNAALAYWSALPEPATCSEVTRVEVLRGMLSAERRETLRLLASVDWIAVDERASTRAGEFGRRYRASHAGIDVADLIIAATADIHGLSLATGNVRHFPMFPDLEAAY